MDERDPSRDWPELDEGFVEAASHRERDALERQLESQRKAAEERAARLRAEEAALIDAGRRRQRRERRRRSLRRALGWKLLSLAGVVALGFIAYHDLHRTGSVRAAARYTSVPTVASTVSPSSTAPEVTSTTIVLALRDYNPGDCVLWDQAPGSSGPFGRQTHVVSCSRPHLVEITSVAEQLNGFGPAWPGEKAIDAYAVQHCAAPTRAFLGYALDPDGRFDIGDIHPLEDAWIEGYRTYYCDLQLRGGAAGTTLTSFAGEVRGADQEWLFPVGSCMTSGSGLPVPCSGPHKWEVTGDVNVPAGTTSMPTSDSGWQQLVGAQCSAVGLRYAGGSYPPGFETSWMPLSASSWAAGERVIECTVGRPLYSGTTSGWATTTGSVHRP